MGALAEFDLKQLQETLIAWPSDPSVPIWEARKASIMAELGWKAEAMGYAEAALKAIRANTDPDVDDFGLLTQEAWIIALQECLSSKNPFGVLSSLRSERQSFATIGYTPAAEIDSLLADLRQPVPRSKPHREMNMDYFKGIMTTTTRTQTRITMEDFLPALQTVRFAERAAIPARCGFVVPLEELTSRAANWLSVHSTSQAIQMAVRAGDLDGIKYWFSPVLIASLPTEDVENIAKCANRGIREAHDHMSNLEESPPSLYDMALHNLPEVLGRLCFRLRGEQLEETLQLSLDMYNSQVYQSNQRLHNVLNSYLSQLLNSADPRGIAKILPQLAELPLAGVKDSKGKPVHSWPEPFEKIDTTRMSGSNNKVPDRTIRELIKLVRSSEPLVRSRASRRLVKLQYIGLMTQSQTSAFANALWSKVEESTGLPSVVRFTASDMLYMPETKGASVKELFRSYAMNANLPDLGSHERKPGQSQSALRIEVFPKIALVEDLLNGSRDLAMYESSDTRLVDWSEGDVAILFGKIRDWWNNQYAFIQIERQSSLPGPMRIEDHAARMVVLLAEVIFPRMRAKSSSLWTEAFDLLHSMKEHGIGVTYALPMTLYGDPDRHHEISSAVHGSLGSMNESEVREAAMGLYRWHLHAVNSILKSPPQELTAHLTNSVTAVRRTGFLYCVAALLNIAKHCFVQLENTESDMLLNALQVLHQVTALRSQKELMNFGEESLELPAQDLPVIRQWASELARIVYDRYQSMNRDIPEVLIDWKAAATSDPFPEVRKFWTDLDGSG